MQKTINVLSTIILLIFCVSLGYAQNSIAPFSRYGVGDIHHYAYGRTVAMGGASLGSRQNIQINTSNPASYNSNDTLSFIIFDFGTDATFSKYTNSTSNLNTNNDNLRYFSSRMLLTKWLGAAIGIQPFSDMDYNLNSDETDVHLDDVYRQYIGKGTTSKAFLGTAVSPFKGLSIGANLNYYCGHINQYTNSSYQQANLHQTSENSKTELRDFSLNYGLQYSFKFKKDQSLTLGMTFEPEKKIKVLRSECNTQAITSMTSTLLDTTKYTRNDKSGIKLPSTVGIGLSYNKQDKFEFNVDYYYAAWSNARFYDQADEHITNQSRFSAGFEFTADAQAQKYLKRISYRAGVHSGDSNIKLNGQTVTDRGISIGLGLPLPESKSIANFAVEFGERGNLANNLIKDKYTKISLYITIFNYWSRKTKTNTSPEGLQESTN